MIEIKKSRKQKAASITLCAVLLAMSPGCTGNNNNDTQATDSSTATPTATPTATADIIAEETEAAIETETATETAEKEVIALIMPGAGFIFNNPPTPVYKEVSVHDPSVMYVDGTYYIIGSHMASAKSDDLMQWTQISSSAATGNKLAPDIKTEFQEALEWSNTATFWAADWIKLNDGRYYMYYCTCVGDSPLAGIGLAVADEPDGPYENQGLFLKSGMWNQTSPDGTVYNATKHPNCVDPNVFYDKEGKLWMVYGSYSGGIYIMEMDADSGLPLPEQGYGKKLLGGDHVRIEGAYIIYSPETNYYYMFLSFGGLDTKGGYNIRVCRSENPDGPYYDAKGQDMINCKGPIGSFFNDTAIEKYGVKLMGGYQFLSESGEAAKFTTGYKSPGHNSAYYDSESGQFFLIFHTRFAIRGEAHEVRVHQMFMNEDGWLVVSPKRYGGENLTPFSVEQLTGHYKIIEHGSDITDVMKLSQTVMFNADGTISGEKNGTWTLGDDGYSTDIAIDEITYNGVFLRQYDTDTKMMVMTFTALSSDGLALWGSGVAVK